MNALKQFNIPYIGLKETSHLFEYQIDNSFFESFQYNEFFDAKLHVVLQLDKKSTFLKLLFTATGTVNVTCDVSGENFDQEIHAELPLLVKFGSEYNDDNDEIVILPYSEFQINVAQYIYEMIILALPSKRVHPKVVDGTMESEALKKLEELRVTKDLSERLVEKTDPRWDKLKGITIEKNT